MHKMAISEQSTVELIMARLETNITDPLSSRITDGKKWIYDDAPRDDASGYPRISIEPVPSNYSEFALGDLSQLEDQTIVISIYSRKTTKMTVGSIVDARAEQIVDELALQIREYIKGAHSVWVANGYLSIRPATKNRSVVGDRVIATMTVIAKVKN